MGQVAGFSLHAGVAAKAHQRQKLERLCRYISRPAVSERRLSLTPNGNVRYRLKTPYRESLPRERSECCGHGTTHVIFQPLDFAAPARPAPAAFVHPCTSSPGSPPWCPSPGSTSRAYADLRIGASMPTSGLCGESESITHNLLMIEGLASSDGCRICA